MVTPEGREQLIAPILEMPARIEEAHAQVIAACHHLEDVKRALRLAEDKLVVAGLEGKNAEQREANLRLMTDAVPVQVIEAERDLTYQKLRLERAENDFSALKAVARLLGGRDE